MGRANRAKATAATATVTAQTRRPRAPGSAPSRAAIPRIAFSAAAPRIAAGAPMRGISTKAVSSEPAIEPTVFAA